MDQISIFGRNYTKFCFIITIICSILTLAGVCIFIPGLVIYVQRDIPEPPYYYSLNLCRVNSGDSVLFVGSNLNCSQTKEQDDNPETFSVSNHVFGKGLPYKPVVLITEDSTAKFTIKLRNDGEVAYTKTINLHEHDKKSTHALCGGDSLRMLRKGGRGDGEYLSNKTECIDPKKGCEYRFLRSLSRYSIHDSQFDVPKFSDGKADLVFESVEVTDESFSHLSHILTPELYVYFEPVANNRVAWILMAIGVIIIDLAPGVGFLIVKLKENKEALEAEFSDEHEMLEQ
eukprot:gb/GECH01006603.1/.p1 GENE.gb/GECH01006603.1/~~gb/GECH01006603.1/.p1  ORF type:complete len:287 (+),score=59.96 gb/GECH01006603.1/:1-861(+)